RPLAADIGLFYVDAGAISELASCARKERRVHVAIKSNAVKVWRATGKVKPVFAWAKWAFHSSDIDHQDGSEWVRLAGDNEVRQTQRSVKGYSTLQRFVRNHASVGEQDELFLHTNLLHEMLVVNVASPSHPLGQRVQAVEG